MTTKTRGFTLIELMIVVAIIGILAAVAVPKLGEVLRKSKDASTKANLGAIRSAISIYAADTDGQFPTDHLESLIAGQKYMAEIPEGLAQPHHASSIVVDNTEDHGAAISSVDSGHWMYFDDASLEAPGRPSAGQVWLGCQHADSSGRTWTVN